MASVASRNLFDILADNEDIESVVPEKEPTPKENVVVQKKVDRSRASPKEARIRHEYPQRGGFKPSPPNSRNEETRSGAPRDRNVGPRLYNRREEGGGDYPGRNSRGARASERGRGARGGGGRRGREYDRHSGTGKYDSNKKETQGWGNPSNTWENNEAIETQNNGGEADANTNTNTSAWGDQPSDNNAGEVWAEPAEGKESGAAQDGGSGWEESAETAAPEEEAVATNGESAPTVEQEEAFKTLDEYRAEKPQKTVVATLPEARKPNEGVDDSQWKDAVPLEKDEEEDVLFAGKEHSYRLKSKKTKAKNFIEIEQTFVEKPGPGYPRGRGRGRSSGPRGRGDRRENRDGRDNYEGENRRRNSGGGRGGRARGRGDYVNLDDQRAFPSLGAA